MREILYVEDDDARRELYATSLRQAGFTVLEARRAEAALALLRDRT